MITKLWSVIAILALGFQLATIRVAWADPGVGIVADATGHVYVADPGANRIWRVLPDGRVDVLLSDRHSHLLRLDAGKTLHGEHLAYRSDQRWDSRFWRYDLRRNEFQWAGPAITAIDPFPDGCTLHLDGAGNAYSWLWAGPDRASQILRRRLPNGNIEILGRDAWLPSKTLAPTAALMAQGRPFLQIVSIAFGATNVMLVVQTDRADAFDADLNHRTIIERAQVPKRTDLVSVPDFMNRFFGALVRSNGDVLIADAGSRQIVRIEHSGRINAINPLADAYFPVGLTEQAGTLYVLEYPDPGSNKPLRVRRMSSTKADAEPLVNYLVEKD